MNAYILIVLFLYQDRAGYSAPVVINFESQKACQNAKNFYSALERTYDAKCWPAN